jgi:hypothetical protein
MPSAPCGCGFTESQPSMLVRWRGRHASSHSTGSASPESHRPELGHYFPLVPGHSSRAEPPRPLRHPALRILVVTRPPGRPAPGSSAPFKRDAPGQPQCRDGKLTRNSRRRIVVRSSRELATGAPDEARAVGAGSGAPAGGLLRDAAQDRRRPQLAPRLARSSQRARLRPDGSCGPSPYCHICHFAPSCGRRATTLNWREMY